MAGNYTVEHADQTKQPITIPPLGRNTATSLTMLGYRSPVYMEAIWTNFLHLLENFARGSPPDNPTPGQIWLDTRDTPGIPMYFGVDYVWHTIGSGVSVGPAAPSSTHNLWYNPESGGLYYFINGSWVNTIRIAVAGACEYNELAVIYNTHAVQNNQVPITLVLPDTILVTDAQWQFLINRVKQLAFIREVPNSTINGITYTNFSISSDQRCGLISVLNQYNKLQALLNQAIVLSTTNPACFESISPPTASAQRTTAWDGTIAHTAVVTFVDTPTATNFFAANGRFVWSAQLTSPTNSHDQAWATLLSSIPTVTITKLTTYSGSTTTNLGFAHLHMLDQQLFAVSTGTGTVQLLARLNSEGNVITITVLYTDSVSGSVAGNLNSQLTFTRTGLACYNNPPIQYPSSTSTGIL